MTARYWEDYGSDDPADAVSMVTVELPPVDEPEAPVTGHTAVRANIPATLRHLGSNQ